MTLGQFRAAGITLTDTQVSKPQLDAAGNLKITSQGAVASGTADSGNPVKVGGVYSATPATLVDGQRGNAMLDARGNFKVVLHTADSPTPISSGSPSDAQSVGVVRLRTTSTIDLYNGVTTDRLRGDANGLVAQPALSSTFWNYAAAASGIVNTVTAVTIKTAAGAAVRNYLKSLTIETDVLGAATELVVRDGAAGPVLWRGKLQTAALPGRTVTFDPPLRGTANTLVEVATLTATVTGGVYVNATGWTAA